MAREEVKRALARSWHVWVLRELSCGVNGVRVRVLEVRVLVALRWDETVTRRTISSDEFWPSSTISSGTTPSGSSMTPRCTEIVSADSGDMLLKRKASCQLARCRVCQSRPFACFVFHACGSFRTAIARVAIGALLSIPSVTHTCRGSSSSPSAKRISTRSAAFELEEVGSFNIGDAAVAARNAGEQC